MLYVCSAFAMGKSVLQTNPDPRSRFCLLFRFSFSKSECFSLLYNTEESGGMFYDIEKEIMNNEEQKRHVECGIRDRPSCHGSRRTFKEISAVTLTSMRIKIPPGTLCIHHRVLSIK